MTRLIEWISPDGAVTSLAFGQGVIASPGVRLGGMPPIRTSEYVVPQQPGARWRQVSHGPREVAIPIAILGDANDPVDAKVSRLAAALDPTRGDGRLRVTRHDGTARELRCRYVDGLSIEEPTAQVDAWQAALVFRAVDPYWWDSVETTLSVTTGGYQGDFFPLFPLRLGEDAATVVAQIDNTGQVRTWPVITITGPLDEVSIENLTTGKVVALEVSVEQDEVVTIDTRPGIKTVESSSEGDLFPNLAEGSSLWPIERGPQDVEISFSGATSASEVKFSYRLGWLTA